MTRHFLKGEAQARFTQDRIDMIPALAKLAVQHAAAFMVVCGDVFDSNHVAPQTVLRSVEKLARFPVPVFILPGNHDPLDAASVYNREEFKRLPESVKVLRDNKVHKLSTFSGVEIVGAPWLLKRSLNDLCAAMLNQLEPVEDGVIRIAVAHGQLDSLMPDQDHPAGISTALIRQALAERKIHYLALGDRHSVTDADDSGRVWYPGTPVATDFNETAPNQVLLVDASVGIDPRPQVEPVTVSDWQFLQLSERIDSLADIETLTHRLESIENKECTVLRLALKGTLKLNENLALQSMLEKSATLFASLRRHERLSDLAVRPDEFEVDSLSLSGYAKSAWEELAQATSAQGPEADSASAALELFYRLASGRSS